ncbi:MAG: NADH:ubiquinone reductase (Na(+)-transporting) subunit C [Muribaculaceae bacterium]|nr:NADH:ubiquinone reductase (Na(+)-transporting) subunit C [Muribaculaceae bacterium]
MNRQSNTYTIIYAMVLVLLVGIGLSVVYQALRPKQEENIANDVKRQILASALIVPSQGETIGELYNQHVKNSFIVNSEGNRLEGNAFDVNVSTEFKKPAAERRLPVFECETSAGMKYVVPVYGAGLWGPIWGYIAFDANGNTIYGAYFAHQGETPGLGAEIESPKFQDQFKNKDIFASDGAFQSIKVVKNGQEPAEGAYVHAISGGTITSQGVAKMLQESLSPYTNFFKQLSQGKEVSK